MLDYWLEHKHGADFITLDRGVKGGHDKHDYSEAELMALTSCFSEIGLQVAKRTNLPLWWAEYYGSPSTPEATAARYASIYYHMMMSNTEVALLWSPQESDIRHALFTDTKRPDGGQPLPHYEVFKLFHDHFGPGTMLYATESSSPDIEVAAGLRSAVVINKRPTPVTVSLPDRRVKLKPYEVLHLDRNPDGD